MMVIENKYEIGQFVYLKTDSEQLRRIITSIKVFKEGDVLYELSAGTTTSLHFDFEFSTEKDLVNVI